jgi:BirA family biotin operon repressor/biotin-[acetyl-CoA-carboxylase] ligase
MVRHRLAKGNFVTSIDLDPLHREPFLARVEFREETSSTNTLAQELSESDDGPYPLLVVGERQTAGRGRGANRWWSDEGALTFSLVLDAAATGLPLAQRPLASLAAGLAVCEALRDFAPDQRLGVKWPNDVHLNERKVGGILVESARRGDRLIVGVGINVNNSLAAAPPDVAERAVSLCDATRVWWPLGDVLARVVRGIYNECTSLQSNSGEFIARLRSQCVLTGRNVIIDIGQGLAAGMCRGIADDGALLVESSSGVRRIYAGVVTKID